MSALERLKQKQSEELQEKGYSADQIKTIMEILDKKYEETQRL